MYGQEIVLMNSLELETGLHCLPCAQPTLSGNAYHKVHEVFQHTHVILRVKASASAQ